MKEFNDWHKFQRFAEDEGYNSVRFMAMFPSGPRRGKWLDAYFGFLTLDGLDGFVTVNQMEHMAPGVLCVVLEDES